MLSEIQDNLKNIALITFLWLGLSINASANTIIKSSVSPEFPDGLHTKYLRYIAEKMDLPLEIYPMSFARRLESLKNGTINLMVGVKHLHSQERFEFLQPSYEKLRASYFVHRDSPYLDMSETELNQLILGNSIDEKEMLKWADETFKAVVSVSSLEQKIRLLEIGRIDTFVHFETSALYKIRLLGLEGVIIPAAYQPGEKLFYHFAINPDSELFAMKEKLEQIIAQGVANGDFTKIRAEHEEALMAAK